MVDLIWKHNTVDEGRRKGEGGRRMREKESEGWGKREERGKREKRVKGKGK